MRNSRFFLVYSGSLPFVFLALCLAFDVTILPIVGDVSRALSGYTLIIAAFMAGSHWGQQLTMSEYWSSKLQVVSNVNAVGLWFGFLFSPDSWFWLCAIASFLVSLRLDYQLRQARLITAEYWRIRSRVTMVVISALAVASVSI